MSVKLKGGGDSNLLSQGPCPGEDCGSSDACAAYDDGHQYCFSCNGYFDSEGGSFTEKTTISRNLAIDRGEHQRLHKRKIDLATCQFFGYTVGEYEGRTAQFAPYFNTKRVLSGIHVRGAGSRGKGNVGKDFRWELAKGTKVQDLAPFGSHRFTQGGRMVVVTEGEIDAMSMSQIQGNKYATVSIPNGVSHAKKYVAKWRDWFLQFDKVVLMFDSDASGQGAAAECAQVLGSKAHIAELPLKDANDMLREGRYKELTGAMWEAKRWRPDNIVTLDDLEQEFLTDPERGLSWPYECMTRWTYGVRKGEIIVFGAGTGIGKTTLFNEIEKHFIEVHEERIGIFSLEQKPRETVTRLCGSLAGKRFHVPNTEEDTHWTQEEKEDAFATLKATGRVFFYDSQGINEWEAVRDHFYYLHHSEGVNYFFLDHLTALAEWQDDPRGAMELLMAEMGSMVSELNITIMVVSHLATPEGTPHEEGGRVKLRHFKHSRGIGSWAHFAFGLERNQQAENEYERGITTLRCLKDRFTGEGAGNTNPFGYDNETGRLVEHTPSGQYNDTPSAETAEDLDFDPEKF